MAGEVIDLTLPDGSLIQRPYERLTEQEAALTRQFYRTMRKRGYVPMLRCVRCGEMDRHDGTRGEVTPTQVRFECRCRFTHHTGVTGV